MILVDTNVWVDHLRQADEGMRQHLAADNLATHPMVIGELACGNLPRCGEALAQLRTLPELADLDDDALLALIESDKTHGPRHWLVGVHLLGAERCWRGRERNCGLGTDDCMESPTRPAWPTSRMGAA